MAYDVNAMTAHFKILIRDPAGNSLTDTQIRDDYLNPAYQDWWRRYERRRGSAAGILNPGVRFVDMGASITVYNPDILEVAIVDPVGSAINLACKRSEWNRVRWLQETEQRVGLPRQWGWNPSVSGTSNPQIAFYPLADITYDFFVRWTSLPTSLTTGTQTVLIDPVSARYVTRLAAYRAALDLKAPERILSMIAAPARAWIEVLSNIRYNIERKTMPRDQAPRVKRFEAAGI